MKITDEAVEAAEKAIAGRSIAPRGTAHAALEAALPHLKGEQEPVGWQVQFDDGNWSNALYSEAEVKEFKASPRGTVAAYRPVYDHPSTELEGLRAIEAAARGVLASWDERGTEQEKLVMSSVTNHEYWSPAASLVSSEHMATLRAALSEAKR